MEAEDIVVEITVSKENVQELIDQYEEITGKLPTREWVIDFLKSDAQFMYNEPFTDDLYSAVAESLLAEGFFEDDDEE